MTENRADSGQQTLDASLVFRIRDSPAVEWVEVDGEIVAWTEANESLHLFDNIAALVFRLMDGTTTLGGTIDDLGHAFGRPTEEIAPDVTACVAHLESAGVIERVA